jgi:hypothetical protein
MKNAVRILLLIALTTIIIFFGKDLKSTPTITYFPIDYEKSFESANTSLEFTYNKGTDYYTIDWHVLSKTEMPMYLRQDVSLLFAEGELHGMRSKWRENTDIISFSETTTDNTSKKWEAISFHYGEIHDGEDIKSIQKLSHDNLYVIEEKNNFVGFHNKQINEINKFKVTIDVRTNKKLLAHWQDLLFYFHINSKDYYLIPLSNLYLYQEKTFPEMDQEKTDRVMGQLWEGLYKNYILPNIDSKEKLKSYIPLILIEKSGDTLLVLYEINGQKEKLIQKIGE